MLGNNDKSVQQNSQTLESPVNKGSTATTNSTTGVKVGLFKQKRKMLLAMSLILCFSTVTFGQLLVHDPLHMQSNILQFAKELAQHVLHHNYIVDMNGRWMSQLKILDKIEAVAASKGIPIEKLGWGKVNRFAKEKATQLSADALDDLNKIIEGKAKASDLGSLQKDLEQIYKPAPVTTAGAKSEHALREMAASTAFVNQSQKAIEEAQKQVDKLQKDVESGNLKPGDLERYQVLIASYQTQIQTWQSQGNNQLLRQQVAQTGLMASEASAKENNRLKNRFEMLQAPKLFQASAKPKEHSEDLAGVE